MDFHERYRIKPGHPAKLATLDPEDTAGYKKDHKTKAELRRTLDRLDAIQEILYAEKKHALAVILQGPDTAGKDGVIRHVMSGLNPQGCQVTSFKAPTDEEMKHDFLWRVHKAAPPRGIIGIFNRSQYEDVMIVRVHQLVPERVSSRYYGEINQFEKMLAANSTKILKFFLHISKDEQKRRLQARIDDPDKHWKLSTADFTERKFWRDYQRAYDEALTLCSTDWAPWYVIPANHKWFRNLAISRIILQAMESLQMKYPKPSFDVSKFRLD
jgi:PPK2 family polyphosphate:nucleotide phosphotransferase